MAHRDKVINGNGNPEAIRKLSGPGLKARRISSRRSVCKLAATAKTGPKPLAWADCRYAHLLRRSINAISPMGRLRSATITQPLLLLPFVE